MAGGAVSTARSVPEHVFLDVFIECNLRCVQCDIYKLKDPPGQLSLDERKAIVGQLAAWNPSIRLVLTGGELFLRRSMLYELASSCREHAVYTTMNSNGSIIREQDFELLPYSGINCIVLSVDSDEAAIHDRIRGVSGTFERVLGSIRRLVEARERCRTDFTVLTSTILGRHNLHRVSGMVDLFERLGVDTMLFQPIQPAFARDMPPNWWLTDPLFPMDMETMDRGIDALIAMRQQGRRLYQTERQFEDMRHYFRYPRALALGQCASMDRHMMIDLFGNVRLCFHMERIGLVPIANVRDRSLRAIWEDAATEGTRSRMRTCLEGCGTMCCHAR